MVAIPKQCELTPRQEHETIVEPLRPYLGMSQLGHSCSRYLWYYFRWCFRTELSRTQLRIFERGNLEEPRVYRDLTEWGYKIPAKQESYTACFGHVKGHSDGVVVGFGDEPAILEIKTMNSKAFDDLLKHGLVKSKPTYFDQAQLYMHFSRLKQTIFIVLNKDNERRKYVKVDYSAGRAEELLRKGEDVILAETPPNGIGGPSWFECKWCDAAEICHQGAAWEKTCRTCQHVAVHSAGLWYCAYHNKELRVDEQRNACENFTILSE